MFVLIGEHLDPGGRRIMHMNMGRRDFVKQSAAAGLLLGFPFLTAEADEPVKAPTPRPDFLALARERMRQDNKPGVVLVIPNDFHQAHGLGDQLSFLIGSTDAARKIAAEPVRMKG